MLAKKYRLTKSRDFRRLQTRGRSGYNLFFKLVFLPNRLAASRLAVVVSTRLSKKAVQRNRLRRQCLEIMRLHWRQISAGSGILLRPRHQTIGQAYPELEKALLALLRRAKLT